MLKRQNYILKAHNGINIRSGHGALSQIDMKEFFSVNGSIPKLNYGNDSTNLLNALELYTSSG